MRRLTAAALGLLFLISTESARAQSLEPLRVPVHMGSTAPWVDLELRDVEGNPVSRCSGRCRLELPVGHYELFVYDKQRLVARHSMRVDEPARWYIEPADPDAMAQWRGVAILGMVLFTAGFLMVSYDFLKDFDFDGGDTDLDTLGYFGLGVTAAGAVLTPLGWINVSSSSLHIEKEPLVREPSPTSSFSPRIQLSLSF